MWVLIVITLLVVLVWLTRTRETFINVSDIDVNLKDMPNPEHIFKRVQSLLNKYDKPEIWAHAAQVMDKDPGQLARMNLDIHNA